MGLMRFMVSPAERAQEEMLQQAYLSGFDRAAWEVQANLEGSVLTLAREVSESACACVPWQVEGHGPLALPTGTLLERPEPYGLPLELARGTISQLRGQCFEWRTAGLVVPGEVEEKSREALNHLAWAAVGQDEPSKSAARAQSALCAALDASQMLASAYAEQAMAVRRRSGRMPYFFGADVGTAPLDDYTGKQFLQTFNSAVVPVCWREVEASEGTFNWTACDRQVQWCRAAGLRVCAGPLLQLDRRSLPDWIYLWEDDAESLDAAVTDFVRAAIERYRGKVDIWICAGRGNSADVLALTEEEILTLTARAIKLVRTTDPVTPAILSIDQPWGEYMSRRDMDFPPLHFADALARAGLDLKGLLLEFNMGYSPGGTLPRTLLEVSRQLDYWSVMGLPLLVSLVVPSAYHDDPQAQRRVSLPPGSWTPKAQQHWVSRYVPLILAKPAVQGILWGQLRDSEPHDFPHGGLFDDRRHAKPALRTLAVMRQTCLK